MRKETWDQLALIKSKNKYEAVNIIAKEVRRLNDIAVPFRKFSPKIKITVLGIQRLALGKIRKKFEEKEEDKK